MRVGFRVRMRAGIRAWVLKGVGDSSIGERIVGEEAAGVVPGRGRAVLAACHVNTGIVCA